MLKRQVNVDKGNKDNILCIYAHILKDIYLYIHYLCDAKGKHFETGPLFMKLMKVKNQKLNGKNKQTK